MADKIYLDADGFLRDCWRLARAVLDSAWRPDVLVALWRGGASPGAAVHEFLFCHGVRPRHACVKCSSYSGIDESDGVVKFDAAAESFFAAVKRGERVLVVDDVFDTGRTAAAVKARLDSLGAEGRVACVYWKPSRNLTSVAPDFCVRKCEEWIVFPHEIDGLSPDEIRRKDPLLAELW